MLSALQTVLTSPERFFERESLDPGLRRPAAVVAVVAVVGLLSSIPIFRAMMGSIPDAAGPFVMVGVAVGAVVGVVSPFAIWLLYTLLFYGLSELFDGQGSLRDLFALVGWGFAPKVLSAVVGAVVTFVLVSNGSFSNPQQVQQFAQTASTGPLGLVKRGVGVLMTLWSAWIWTNAVAAGRALNRRAAAISVGVVVAAEILLGVGSTLLL